MKSRTPSEAHIDDGKPMTGTTIDVRTDEDKSMKRADDTKETSGDEPTQNFEPYPLMCDTQSPVYTRFISKPLSHSTVLNEVSTSGELM